MSQDPESPRYPIDFEGRTILVTGASSGIGRAACISLASLGAQLILVGRDDHRLRETMGQLAGSNHQVETFDLLRTNAICPWMKSLAAESGPWDGLVHSAGVLVTRPLRYLDCGTFDETMQINVAAAVQLAKGFRQKGVCNENASVVFLSSMMGLVGQAGLAAYSASKGALIALARSLALEYARDGIRFNCIAPGLVETEMAQRLQKALPTGNYEALVQAHPLGVGKPQDVAHAITFLLSDAARWITGTTLVVDGGYTAQ